ncbi:MAG: hypothetical protein KBT36_09195 [Kurthia sp.]|nr:hypothetical protein [Candidatus Kurthia equi]
MKKVLPYVLAATVTVSSVSAVVATEASAKTAYSVKKGQLIHAKTGKVATSTIVYKNKLYKKGKLAKGIILYKNILYVNGKISSNVVKYKNTFYKKGKKVNASTKFLYKDVLYKGQKPAVGYQTKNDEFGDPILYKEGKRYTGFYQSVLYDEGMVMDYGKYSKYDYEGFIYKADGSQIIYTYNFESAPNSISIDTIKTTITGGATVSDVKIKDKRLFITLDNTTRTGSYQLSISGVQVKKIGEFSVTESFTGLPAKLEKIEGFTELNDAFWKYKDYTPAQVKKIPKKEISKALLYAVESGVNYGSSSSRTLVDGSYDALLLEFNRLFAYHIRSMMEY